MSTIRVDVGTPPTQWTNNFKEWTTVNVCFHRFATLSTTRNDYVSSPEFSCFGHQWKVAIYPGGRPNTEEGYTAVILGNFSTTGIKIQYGFSVRDSDGEVVAYHETAEEFDAKGGNGMNARSVRNFAKRSKLIDILVEGSLIIELRMKPTSTDKSITQFIPTNPINKNVLQKFNDEESADVLFEVDNEHFQSDEHTNKKSRSTTTFYAHRFILQDVSTMLTELCKPAQDGGGIATVSITGVKPEIFKHMIFYTYGGKISEAELKSNAKDIMNACDKYGVVHLKLEAEACYVDSTEITMDNMMDNLLYADSKNLALLKEAVMDYIVANKGDIIGKVSFNDLPGSIATDLLTAMARGEQSGDGDSKDYNKMRVGKLRKMLDEKGLDVDGSREAMIALLKEQND